MADIIELRYDGDKKTLVEAHFKADTTDANGLLLNEPVITMSFEQDGNYGPWVNVDRLQGILEQRKQDFIEQQKVLRDECMRN